MQLVKINGTQIENVISITGITEADALSRYDGYEVNNFNFEQPTNCYEYNAQTEVISLKTDWEDLLPTPPPVLLQQISPITYKMLWTIQERIALKSMRATDDVIAELFELIDDPRMTKVNLNLTSVQQAIQYCLSKLEVAEVITEAEKATRYAAIMTGNPQ